MISTVSSLRFDLINRLKEEDFVAVAASEQEYLDIAFEFPHRIEYHHAEIIAMGLSSYIHEKIIIKLAQLLGYTLDPEYYDILGSNAGVRLEKFEGGYYQPDLTVVKVPPVFKGKSKSIITNPFLLVEVLSKSTSKYDMEGKLPEYKHFDSLQYILFVDQKEIAVSLFIKSDEPNTWINKDYYTLNDVIKTDDFSIAVKEIYYKIEF